MSKKLIVVLVVILIMGLGIVAGVYLVQQQTGFREKAAPASTLGFSAGNLSPYVDDDVVVTATIDTGTNQVIASELYINFDATKLELTSVSQGTFLPNAQDIGPNIDNTAGSLSYTLYLMPGSTPQTGQGSLAVLNFKAKAAGNAQISYASNSIVGAVQEDGKNVLSSSTPLTLNIRTQGALSPTPTQASSPTPTVGGGIGGDGGASPTPTITPTPTKTPTPTPTSSSSTSSGSSSDTGSANDTNALTGVQQLPDSGLPAPTLIFTGVGILILIGALIIAI